MRLRRSLLAHKYALKFREFPMTRSEGLARFYPAIAAMFAAGTALAGPLNPPPGPIASTYKTLTEVQPRTPISSVPFTISSRGSYYLTQSMSVPTGQVGITINALGATLDLSGFTLDGGLTSNDLIRVNSMQGNATIRNGALRGMGADAIHALDADGLTVENMTIDQGAAGGRGIVTGRGATISGVYIREIQGQGIVASYNSIIKNCAVQIAIDGGIFVDGGSTVSNCTAVNIGGTAATGFGFSFGTGTIATDCNSRGNVGDGFITGYESLLRGCSSTANGANGFVIGQNTRIVDCVSSSNAASGVRSLDVGGWAVERSTLTNNASTGVSVEGISSQSRIDGNVIQGPTGMPSQGGVRISAGVATIVIVNNQISQFTQGVVLDGQRCRITGNAFSALTFVPVANSAGGGINANNLVGPQVTSANIAAASNPFANTLQ